MADVMANQIAPVALPAGKHPQVRAGRGKTLMSEVVARLSAGLLAGLLSVGEHRLSAFSV